MSFGFKSRGAPPATPESIAAAEARDREIAILEQLRGALAAVDQDFEPDAQERIYRALVAHVRSRRPDSVVPLGTLPPPGEVIRDPRGER